jgi:hypothetical protein
MFNPPEELHAGFDKAVTQLKANLGKEYGMIIDGKDVFTEQKFEDHSPVNTEWILAVMQKGNATHADAAIAAAAKLPSLAPHTLAGARKTGPKSVCHHREAYFRTRGGNGT